MGLASPPTHLVRVAFDILRKPFLALRSGFVQAGVASRTSVITIHWEEYYTIFVTKTLKKMLFYLSCGLKIRRITSCSWYLTLMKMDNPSIYHLVFFREQGKQFYYLGPLHINAVTGLACSYFSSQPGYRMKIPVEHTKISVTGPACLLI